MALLNTFNGYHFLPVVPNWDEALKHTLQVSCEENGSLRGNEERMAFRETPRAIIEYVVWPGTQIESQNISDIKRYCLDQNQGKVCVPYWVRPAIVNASANAGATSIVVDTTAALCPAFLAGDVIYVPNPLQDGTYFTRTLTSVTGSGTTLNFTGGTPFNVGPLDRVYPLHYGRVDPQPATQFDGNTASETIIVTGDGPARAPFAGSPPLFGSRPVFDMPLDWNEDMQSTQVYDKRVAELGAQVVDEAMQKYTVNAFTLPRDCWSRAETAQIELLYRATYGPQQGFFLPEPERWGQVAAAVDRTHFDVLGRGLVETFSSEPGATTYLWALDQSQQYPSNPFPDGIIAAWDSKRGVLNGSGVAAANGDNVKDFNSFIGGWDLQQATVGNQPRYDTNIFGSDPGIYFGTGKILTATVAHGNLGSACTLYVVHLPQANTPSGTPVVYSSSGDFFNDQIISAFGTQEAWCGAYQGAPLGTIASPSGFPQVTSWVRNGAAATEGANGSYISGAVTNAGTNPAAFSMGGDIIANPQNSYKGWVRMVLHYNVAHTLAQQQIMQRYLAALCQIPIASRGLQVTAVATSGSNERCTTPVTNWAIEPADDLVRLRYARFTGTEILFEHDTEDTCRVALSFVELPHEYAAVDLGQRPAYLYRITRPSIGPVYWTSYDQSIAALSQTFVPAAIEHESISESTDGQDNAVILNSWRTQAGSPFVQPAPFATGEEILVEIFRYDLQTLAAPSLEWVGVVDQIQIIGRRLTITCATRLNRMGNTLPRWRVQRRCNTQVYSAACGILRSSRTRNPVVSSVTQAGRLLRLVLTGIGSLPASYHVFGEVKSLSEYRQIEAVTIINANTIDVRIEHPFAVDPVVSVAVETAEGCDLSREACVNQFNNLVNMRGHPFIDENLALKAIELQSGGGKK